MNISNVWSFAQIEMRLARRLARYWVFLVLSYLMGLGLYLYFSVVHAVGSSVSASIGFVGPRFLISSIGFFYLATFIVGTLLLTFEIRSRDQRVKMLEVLDARPYSNLDLVFGRFLGLFALAWVPLLILAVGIQGLGAVLELIGSPVGRMLEPASLANFALFVAVPAIALSCALSMLVAVVVRQPVVALLLSLLLLGVFYAASLGALPYAATNTLDLFGFRQMGLASDWLPGLLPEAIGLLQRAGLLALSIAALLLAAACHPRLEDRRALVPAVSGATAAVGGIAMLGLVFVAQAQRLTDKATWLSAQQQVPVGQVVDVVDIDGALSVGQDDALSASFQLTVRAIDEQPVPRAAFTLNPGYQIQSVASVDGAALDYEFADGVLYVDLPEPAVADTLTTFSIEVAGRLDPDFGYLDSALDIRQLAVENGDIELLGRRSNIVDRRFVALLPGAHWLPAPGAVYADTGSGSAVRDFYLVSLVVETPDDWLVAGPGAREVLSTQAGRARFRFAPNVALSEVALVAAPFERYHRQIEGIDFEVLVHPAHAANVAALAEGASAIDEWVGQRIALARNVGLDYPFGAFSLVEVPNDLRGFGGGWQMASALAPPAMVLMKETSLPTARFDFNIADRLRESESDNRDEGRLVLSRLYDFFNNDFTGGNVFAAFARSCFSHRVGASGADHVALDYTLAQLATLLVSGQRSYFSVERIGDLGSTIEALVDESQRADASVPQRVIHAITSQDAVRTAAQSTSLSALTPSTEPGLGIDVLALKAGGAAELLFEYLRPEGTGALLRALLDGPAGQTFSRDDVVQALVEGGAAEHGDAALASSVPSRGDLDLANVFAHWFTSPGLSGFAVDGSALFQLADTANGDAQIQLKVTVDNTESVAGFVRIAWSQETNGDRTRSEIIRIPAGGRVEYGAVLLQAPAEVYVEPYLSRHATDLLAGRFAGNKLERRTTPAFDGVKTLSVADARDPAIARTQAEAQL